MDVDVKLSTMIIIIIILFRSTIGPQSAITTISTHIEQDRKALISSSTNNCPYPKINDRIKTYIPYMILKNTHKKEKYIGLHTRNKIIENA